MTDAVERMVGFRGRDVAIGDSTFQKRGNKGYEEAGLWLELEDILEKGVGYP